MRKISNNFHSLLGGVDNAIIGQVLTQYRINRQILDLNCLPPGAPYVSSHDSTMPL